MVTATMDLSEILNQLYWLTLIITVVELMELEMQVEVLLDITKILQTRADHQLQFPQVDQHITPMVKRLLLQDNQAELWQIEKVAHGWVILQTQVQITLRTAGQKALRVLKVTTLTQEDQARTNHI
jgi:hypothetical protein